MIVIKFNPFKRPLYSDW